MHGGTANESYGDITKPKKAQDEKGKRRFLVNDVHMCSMRKERLELAEDAR